MIAEKDVMDMRRCVIVGGAEIRTYDRVRQYFRPDDFFIYCDCTCDIRRRWERSRI